MGWFNDTFGFSSESFLGPAYGLDSTIKTNAEHLVDYNKQLGGTFLELAGMNNPWDKDNSGVSYDDNIKYQKEFAQHGVSWRVADARRAGIHPLAALGANTASFSPVPVGQDGQNISRSIRSGMDSVSRALDLRYKRALIKQAEADAGMAQDALIHSRQTDNSKPVPSVIEKPFEQTMSVDKHGAVSAGSPPSVQFYPTATGGIGSSLSKDIKELLEDSPEETMESVKRLVSNFFGSPAYKPQKSYWKAKFPDAIDVKYSFKTNDYQPVYKKDLQKSFKKDYRNLIRKGLKRTPTWMDN